MRYKVLVFLESEIARIEEELNALKGYSLRYSFNTQNGRFVFVMEQNVSHKKKTESIDE